MAISSAVHEVAQEMGYKTYATLSEGFLILQRATMGRECEITAHVRPGQACIVLSELTRSVLAGPTVVEWEILKKIMHNSPGVL